MIQLHDKQFVPFISAKEIEFALTKMVAQIEDDFADEIPVFVGVLNTGNTLVELKELFKKQNVKHFKIATLFFKPEAYTKDIKIDYIGIRIPNKFIVGYGLDYDGLGRNLSEIYKLKE